MFKVRYSGVWVRLSYVPCLTFILHTPLLSSSYLPPPAPSSEAPPPCTCQIGSLYFILLFLFLCGIVCYTHLARFLYILYTPLLTSLIFFSSQSSLVVSLDQDSDSRWPPRPLRSPAHWSSIYGRLSREKVNRLSQATEEKY